MPEPVRITVALRIVGDILEPDDVTHLLGVEPTSSERKGDAHRAGSGREVIAQTGSWRLEADASAFGDLNPRIASLFAGLPDDPAVWRELSRRFRCDVFCGLFMDGGNAGASCSPKSC